MVSAWVSALVIWAAPVFSQVINTVAGTAWIFPTSAVQALSAPLGALSAVVVDGLGNTYAADPENNVVLRVSPGGMLTIVAGNGYGGFSGDGGPATKASLSSPEGIAIDSAGNLYIADSLNSRIRKVSGGTITTVVGSGKSGFSGDGGPATNAALSDPGGVAVDAAGNIYVVDTENERIRKISGGVITTIAGNGALGFSGDGGPATSASFFQPQAVAIDSGGNLYIADALNNRVRKISNGQITTVAGNGSARYSGDGGPAVSASLNFPFGLTVDAAGNLYIADAFNNRIRKVSGGVITTVAGNGNARFTGDGGPANSAAIDFPSGVAVDASGIIYIADTYNNRIRVVSGGSISTAAGNGAYLFAGDGGLAKNASINLPAGVAMDAAGTLYIADSLNNRIRKVSGGMITTVAGNGNPGFSGDGGPAINASLYYPQGVAVDSAGNLYIADSSNNRIRKVSGGVITTVAGNGVEGFSGDGGSPASASLYGPLGVAVDSSNNLYIADAYNNRIRKIAGGIITTVAGNGNAGFSGDGGAATSASLSNPGGVAVDSIGNFYIADSSNNRIRKVSGGAITTVAGNGNAGFSGDGGAPVSASLYDPAGVGIDSAGNIYIADSLNNRIRMVAGGIIATVAGNGEGAYSGDGGAAAAASLYYPYGVAMDSHGDLFIADGDNNRIREVFGSAVTYQAAPLSLSFSGTSGGSSGGAQTINLSSTISGLSFTAATSDPWLSVSPAGGSMPAVLTVTGNPGNLGVGTFQGTVTITATNAVPSIAAIAVTLTVLPSAPPALGLDAKSLNLTATQGSGPVSQPLHILNTGGGSLGFAASAFTTSGGSWLTASPAAGAATASQPATVNVTATPGSLTPGTYNGSISVSAAGGATSVPVTLSVSPATPIILLSQTALSFNAVAHGGLPLPGGFGILNTGQGSMNWSATASTLSGGNWLQISPSSGTVRQPYLDVSLVDVSINPSGLEPGTYYGQIVVSAVAANSPQVMTVILTVLPAGYNLGPQVFPSGIIFSGAVGMTPGSQNVKVGNTAGATLSYQSGRIGSGFSFLPTNASVPPDQPTTLQVFPDFSGLAPGAVQQGTITLQFSDQSPSQTVNVLLVVAPTGANPSGAGGSLSGEAMEPLAATNCASMPLQIQFRSLQTNFRAVVGQPTTLDVQVSDGCGGLVGSGASVAAGFSNGDAEVPMTAIGAGIWQGTWRPLNVAGSVVVNIAAYEQVGNLGLVGAATLSGGVFQPQPLTPTVTAQGVVHAASDQPGVPIAPGALISIFGTNLADGVSQIGSLPLPQQVNGAQVLLGNQPLPILYTSPGQLNVQVPYSVPVNTQYQLTAQNGVTLSVPQQLVVAQAQPGIFTVNEQGTGQGSILHSDGVTLAQPGTPASVGETVVIYCAGLGAVTPAVAAGAPAPSAPLSQTVSPVTVTIGGQSAQVSFSGLTPGFPGLYQINAVIPNGVTAGDAVAVVIGVAGQTSPAVTMAVQ
jgi:uncharacterized protein (TIGR03437 family)